MKTHSENRNVVVVKDLRMVYPVGGVEVSALRGVDLVIQRGEFVAVMGPSGCGKSTLLHIVGGLLQSSSGQVLIDGVDISSANDAERTRTRARKMGFVFQNFNLLSALTAKDNIELAQQFHKNGHSGKMRASQLAYMLGLLDKMHHRPSELSRGEQQRVAIARALINQPSILLADEPTGSLDADNSKRVLRMLELLNVQYSQTIMMVTHDPEAARTAHRIVEMRDGQIVETNSNF